MNPVDALAVARVAAIAAVLPAVRCSRERASSGAGIEVDVATQAPEVASVFNRERLVSPLKEITPLNRSDDTWIEVAKLQASDGGTSDDFGRSVDIEGDTIVLSAWSGDIEIADSGSVYFFERQNDGIWVEQGEVTASDAQPFNAFGTTKLDLQGNTLVVGDWIHDTNTGSAFVFSKSDSVIVASDLFESGTFSGGLGQWSSGGWTVAGDAAIRTNADEPHSGISHARLRRGTGDLQRTVDVTGLTGVKLQFWSRLNSFEGSDLAHVQVSGAGSTWSTLYTFINGDDDNHYHH